MHMYYRPALSVAAPTELATVEAHDRPERHEVGRRIVQPVKDGISQLMIHFRMVDDRPE